MRSPSVARPRVAVPRVAVPGARPSWPPSSSPSGRLSWLVAGFLRAPGSAWARGSVRARGSAGPGSSGTEPGRQTPGSARWFSGSARRLSGPGRPAGRTWRVGSCGAGACCRGRSLPARLPRTGSTYRSASPWRRACGGSPPSGRPPWSEISAAHAHVRDETPSGLGDVRPSSPDRGRRYGDGVIKLLGTPHWCRRWPVDHRADQARLAGGIPALPRQGPSLYPRSAVAHAVIVGGFA
jgi:hypothetical protein